MPHGVGIWSPGLGLELLTTPADIVHAHAFGYFPTWAASAARKLGRSRLVVTPHSDVGTGTSGSRLYARTVARGTLARADRVVALTSLEAQHLQRLGVDPRRIVTIPNGIDLKEFPPRGPRPPVGVGARILFVGRIYPEQKGLETLVRAMARLPSGLGVRLRMVGEDWGGAVRVKELARALGIADRIELPGPVPRDVLRREYARADLFVLPSLFEPFGIVLLEAMAAGLPIIASRVGGIPEVVEEGRNALLVPPGDVDALAEAMRRLIADESLARRFSAASYDRVGRFSWEHLVGRFVDLFEELLGEAMNGAR